MYLIAAPNYGYFRDELYYLACGEHPAWGYVDQPPLIAWMAWLPATFDRHFPLCVAPASNAWRRGCDLYGRALSQEMHGGWWAMFLSSAAVLVVPIYLGPGELFTMNAFDPLLWTLLAWLIMKLSLTGNQKLLLTVGAVIGLTLLKLSVQIRVSDGLIGEPTRGR
jgi:hypothetical protein